MLERAQGVGDLGVARGEFIRDAGVAEGACGGTLVVVAENAGRRARGPLREVQRAGADSRDRQRAQTRGSSQGKRVLGEQLRAEVARVDGGADIDAELLEERTLHLGHGDLEHHLLFALDGQQVDDELGVAAASCGLLLGLTLVLSVGPGSRHERGARILRRTASSGIGSAADRSAGALVGGDELAGDIGSPLAVQRRAHSAGQDCCPTRHFGPNVRPGHEALQHGV